MNKVIMIGRLTREADISYTQTNNMCVAKFSLAVNRRFVKEGEERKADFINCTAFGKTAEFVSKYFHKGQQAGIVGRLQSNSWEVTDPTTGEISKRYSTDVIVEETYFADSPKQQQSDMQNELNTTTSSFEMSSDELPF